MRYENVRRSNRPRRIWQRLPVFVLTLPQIKALVDQMKGPNGLSIRTRKWMLKSYENVFVGKEAVDWMVNNKIADDRASAVELGNVLQDLKVVA